MKPISKQFGTRLKDKKLRFKMYKKIEEFHGEISNQITAQLAVKVARQTKTEVQYSITQKLENEITSEISNEDNFGLLWARINGGWIAR